MRHPCACRSRPNEACQSRADEVPNHASFRGWGSERSEHLSPSIETMAAALA